MLKLLSKYLRSVVLIVCTMVLFSPRMRAQQSPHGEIAISCTDCHTTASWKELATPMAFKHSATGFDLQGKHVTIACIQCHITKKFANTSSACFGCHQQDYVNVLDPNHKLGNFSHECTPCHTVNGWRPSVFQHVKTNFQLVGAHQTVNCASCHTNNRFAGLSSDCFSCHQQTYNQTITPNHKFSQFSRECTACHTMLAWKPATLDHNKTNFPLLGAHITTDCASCHKNSIFKGTATDCYVCHTTDFALSKTTNHVTGQFSHDCTPCHTMLAWKPATLDHNKTNFPLLGAHLTTDCIFCHKNGQFKGTLSDCYSCHVTNFSGVVDPNHVTGKYDHNCVVCHTTTAWSPATFDHSKTIFPLTGAHVRTACASCHIGGKYIGLTKDCYTCHITDYTTAKNPDHGAGLYAHDCLTCHNTSVWQPWTFNHDPEYKISKHHGSSVTCAKCHTVPGNLAVASCTTGCHSGAHNKTQTCYIGSKCHVGSSN